jgi:hypothetical protein
LLPPLATAHFANHHRASMNPDANLDSLG